jgi:hypothetical protein
MVLTAVSMLDRDEDWQQSSPAPPEVRQYRKQLVQHVAALSFSVGVGAR